MSLIIPATTGLHVDTKYAPICEPNLYSNAWLVPGVTCTDKYQISGAGQIMIHKLTGAAIEPGTPGRDFTHTEQADSEIPILLNNNFQTSRKMYQVAMEAISAPIAEEALAVATQDARMGIEQSALACLYSEAGKSLAGGAVSKDSIKHVILKARAELSKGYAKGGVVVLSTDAYSALVESAGAEFTPTHNDLLKTTGRVGMYYGMTIFECNALANASKYYNNAGTLVTVTAQNMGALQGIMWDAEALSVVKSLNAFRLVDGGKDFLGTLAQVEINAGLKLTNTACAIKITTAAS